MVPIYRPSLSRRFMTERGNDRRYHRSADSALKAGGVLWVPLGTGWTADAEAVARALKGGA